MSHSSLALVVPVAVVLLVLAAGSLLMAIQGWQGSLRRNGRLGVRTPAASASDDAFAVANKVAAPVFGGAAAVGILVAALMLGLRLPTFATIVVALLGLIAMVALLAAGGRLGERAARTVPIPARAPGSRGGSGCDGCACGSGGCAGLTRVAPGAAAGAGPTKGK